MKILHIDRSKELKKFAKMPKNIYRGDRRYVPYIKSDLKKTLKKLVLIDKTYSALAVEEDGKIIARVLFTVSPSKQLKRPACGYFSHFECVNDKTCSRMLLEEMCSWMKERGADYAEGTYFPFDQDNRRGILVEGFDEDPMILTSYNPPYYADLLEDFGFHKDFDAVNYRLDYSRFDVERVEPLVKKILDRYGLYVCHADFKNIEREIEDLHEVIAAATTDVIFDEAPSRENLKKIFSAWKSFLWEDFIFFCRRKEDNKAVGVMMSVPDFNEVFRKMRGKTDPFTLAAVPFWKRKISGVRAMLQYVIPQYQQRGVNFALYHAFYLACKAHGIKRLEAGTIMEQNEASRKNVEKASGILNKVYRIYGKEI